MNINKFNSNTPVKDDRIGNEYNQYRVYNVESGQNYNISEHIHNNVNNFYKNLVNLYDIHNSENTSNNTKSLIDFKKNANKVKNIDKVSKTQINSSNNIYNINNIEKVDNIYNINRRNNSEHNQKSCISDIVAKNFNNDNLLNDGDVFNFVSNQNINECIQNVHNKCKSKKKLGYFNFSNNIEENKKHNEENYNSINEMKTYNSERGYINSKLNSKIDNLNGSYINTGVSVLKIKNTNNEYMNSSYKNDMYEIKENGARISRNNSENEKLCFGKFSTLNEIQKMDYNSEKDNYNFKKHKNRYDSGNIIENNNFELKESVEKCSNINSNYYYKVHYSKSQESRNIIDELKYKIKNGTYINKGNDDYVYFNSINNNFKDVTNIKITDKKNKNLTESCLNNVNENYRINIFNDTIGCNSLTYDQKFTENKNDNYSYYFIKSENIEEKEDNKCEVEKNVEIENKEKIINCAIIESHEKKNITYKKMEEKENNRIDIKNCENIVKKGEIMLKFDEKELNENINSSNILHCLVRNKKKTIKDNKSYICNYQDKNMIKYNINLINDNKDISKVIEKLSYDHKNTFFNYQDKNISDSYIIYNRHNTNNINTIINNDCKNIKQEDEKKIDCNESKIFKNRMKNKCEYATDGSEEKNQLTGEIYYDSKNIIVKDKENLLTLKNEKNKNSCYVNGCNLLNILKKNNSENLNSSKCEKKNYQKGSLDYYEDSFQNYFSRNKMICKNEEPTIHINDTYKCNYDKKKENEEKKEFKNIIQKLNEYSKKNNTESETLKKSRTFSEMSSNNILKDSFINKKIKTNFQNEKSFNNSNKYILESVKNTVNKMDLILPKIHEIKTENEIIEENNLCTFKENIFNQDKYNTTYLNRSNNNILTGNIAKKNFEVKNDNFLCEKFNLKYKGVSNFIKGQQNELHKFLEIFDKNQIMNKNRENEVDEFLEIYDKIKKDDRDEFLEIYDKNKGVNKNMENKDEFLEIYNETKSINKNKENELDEFLEIYDKNKNINKDQQNELHKFLEIYDKNKNINKDEQNELDEFLEIYDKNKNKENELDEFLEIYDKNKNINKNQENELHKFLEIYDKNKNINKDEQNELDEFLEIYDKNKNINKNMENELDEFLEIYNKTINMNKNKENDILKIYSTNKNNFTNNSLFMYTSRKEDKIDDEISNEMKNVLSNNKSNLSAKNLNGGNSQNNSEFIYSSRGEVRIYEENLEEMKNKFFYDKCNSYTNSANSYKENKIDKYLETYRKIENMDKNKENETDEFLEIYDQINNEKKNKIINNSLFINDLRKEVEINKENLNEMKDKLFDDNDSCSQSIKKNNDMYNSFTYASGKEVKINKEILKEMKNKLFDDNDSCSQSIKKNNEIYSSFTYASGKEVNINKEILKEMKNKLFDDNDSYSQSIKKNNDMYNSFTYASGKEVKINKEILKEMKNKLFDDNDSCSQSIKKNNEMYSSFTYASGKEVNINKENLKEMKCKLFDNGVNSYTKNMKNYNIKNIPKVSYVSKKKEKIDETFIKEQEKVVCCDKNLDIKNDTSYSEKNSLSKSMVEIYDKQNLKEQESYESEGYDEIMKKEVNLFKNENSSILLDNNFSPHNKNNIKLSNGLRTKKDFINPRQRKTIDGLEGEKKSYNNKNKELNLNIDLRNHLKLIKNMYINLSKIKKLNNGGLTNTLMFTNENKNPSKFNWFNNDYLYFFKSRKKSEYYISDINELYELFILITKELKIFCTYDYSWFSKKYKLITMALIRKYKKELRKKYKYIKRETFKNIKQDFYNNISYEEYYKNFIHVYLKENTYLKKIPNIGDTVLKNTQEEIICVNDELGKSENNIYDTEKIKFKDECVSLYNNKRKFSNEPQKYDEIMYDNSINDVCKSSGIYEFDKYKENKLEYKKMKNFNHTMMIIKSIDEIEPPSPIEFIFKLLKRYIEEKKNKKCILQLMQDNIITYKIPVNLRVEKIIKKQDEFVIILSDNFDYIYCMIKDSYLKNLLNSNKIKEGNILKINSFDLYDKVKQEDKNIYFKNSHFMLSSNNLIDIDRKNQLKIGISKYKAKKIRHIHDFGSNCFFIDVIIISKSDFSYGFYDPSRKKFFLLNSNVYEKIVYNLKNEITKILHDENFIESSKYVKLKNDLNMFLEATPFCTIQAVDFASSEKIKETKFFDDKVQHIMNSLCQIKIFKIDNETYENLKKGYRIQLFNVFVQKSNKNNKFSQCFDENLLDDFIYNTFQKRINNDYMKRPLNYNMFQSYFLKEKNIKTNNNEYFNEYDNYIKCFNSSFLTRKYYTPIVFQATHSTYINLNTNYKSKLFEELQSVLNIENNIEIKENSSICEVKEIKSIYPSFIYTNIYKIPVLSNIHFNIFKNSLKLNGNTNNLYFDLIQGNIYNISGLIIHYTDIEIKEVIDHKSNEDNKKILYYKIFLLTSNGNLCCINISMIFPDFLASIYKKDYEYKEREILKKMIHIEYEEIKEKKDSTFKELKVIDNNQLNTNKSDYNNNNQLFNYLYKCEKKNYERYNNKNCVSSKDLDIFIFFKNLEFINYDEKYDIFNFRSYYHPYFDFLKLYSYEFEKIKTNIIELINENYITYEKNKFVIKLQENYKIKIQKNKLSSLHFLYILIYSKCKSMELTGVCLKNNYLSNFLKDIWSIFVK
ncbi:conserved Plasmodium protein, unknown function [Plasmodium gallinaceum]|uniref:Uncharacterized protein n=1 Tax=Plasmodium gallinaceum TaxID=5849 RepID=A0A1J1GUM3_PLAGA|nr:conserved Plasmodium protein, unknown function [Plasmodium gallinaceum]CRG95008.1 conserved Plasmodium protein, unknown function [Plasmodium gallinaceum]